MPVTNYTVVNGRVLSENRNGTKRDYVSDSLGNTVALLDSTQAKTDTFTYWPYGEVRTRTGTNVTPFQFVGTLGYYRDSAQRTYVRARYLAMWAGRWLTPNRIRFRFDDWNAYRYVRNTSVNLTDPTGLICIKLGGGSGVVIGCGGAISIGGGKGIVIGGGGISIGGGKGIVIGGGGISIGGGKGIVIGGGGISIGGPGGIGIGHPKPFPSPFPHPPCPHEGWKPCGFWDFIVCYIDCWGHDGVKECKVYENPDGSTGETVCVCHDGTVFGGMGTLRIEGPSTITQ